MSVSSPIKRFILCVISYAFMVSPALSKAPDDFYQAKQVVYRLFKDHKTTLYCQCPFNERRETDLKACGMQSASHIKRARRVEIEHMMPAENFGRQFKCWREKLCVDTHSGRTYKGRKCCQKISAEFRQAEAELYNLWPAVGLVNQARSNFRYSPLPQKNGFYGCAMEIDKSGRKASPPSPWRA